MSPWPSLGGSPDWLGTNTMAAAVKRDAQEEWER